MTEYPAQTSRSQCECNAIIEAIEGNLGKIAVSYSYSYYSYSYSYYSYYSWCESRVKRGGGCVIACVRPRAIVLFGGRLEPTPSTSSHSSRGPRCSLPTKQSGSGNPASQGWETVFLGPHLLFWRIL